MCICSCVLEAIPCTLFLLEKFIAKVMAIAAGPLLAFGAVVLGFSFFGSVHCSPGEGFIDSFFSGRYFAGHFVGFRHALANRLGHLSFDMSNGSTLTPWRAIGRANCIWHGERIHFWHFGDIHKFAPICFQASSPTILVFGSGGSRRNFRLVLE